MKRKIVNLMTTIGLGIGYLTAGALLLILIKYLFLTEMKIGITGPNKLFK